MVNGSNLSASITEADRKNFTWPCVLPHRIQRSLLDMAEYRYGVDSLEINRGFRSMSGVFFIKRGSASICLSTGDMRNITGGVLGQGDWIGANAMISERKLFAVIEELEDLEMIFFPKQALLEYAEQEPFVYKWLMHCAQRAHSIWMQAILSSMHDKEFRVIYAVIELAARQHTIKGSMPQIEVSQTQLAGLTGLSRSRLNETLKEIELRGAIEVQRGRIIITDKQAMFDALKSMNLMFRNPSEYAC